MNVKIKICGIRNEMEINIMNDLRPDYVGFIFVPSSRKFIAPEFAGQLRAKLKSGIDAVGVFSDESLDTVAMTAELSGLNMVQLNGHESGEYVSVLREYVTCPIIKTFKVNTAIDAERAMGSRADYVLLDTGNNPDKNYDWVTYVRRKYFLSGGLTPDNVKDTLILNQVPFALDVSEGVESNRLKDYRKVLKFINTVREFKSRQ